MRLLVSVRNAAEARIAVDAGADIIDAKEPAKGALGPVGAETLCAIGLAVAQRRPLSAALGEFRNDASGAAIMGAAHAAARARVAFVKAGVYEACADTLMIDCARLVEMLQHEAASDAHCDVVLGVYADLAETRDCAFESVIDVTIRTRPTGERFRIAGVLLDTISKDGRPLFDVMSFDRVATWVKTAHDAGLFVALAGSLAADHVGMARDTGADIMGVRGAACDGGRRGHVSTDRVRQLANAIREKGTQGGRTQMSSTSGHWNEPSM